MKSKLIFLMILPLFFFSSQSISNPIEKINFIGLNTTIESSLLESLSFKVGQDFSDAASDQIIQELFNTGYFSDIQVVKRSNDLEISVKENPIIKIFEFAENL